LTVGTAMDVHSFEFGVVGKGMSLSGTNASLDLSVWVGYQNQSWWNPHTVWFDCFQW